jgi:translation initiation factor 2 subunit 1
MAANMERLPQLREIVLGQITKVMQFGAYCRLSEYNLEVFIPLREVSFGWIKNIREHLHVGQNVVCKIIYFDRERGTIDASIKQVTPKEEKDKISTFKLEKRLSALFMQTAKHSKVEKPEDVSKSVLEKFGTFTEFTKNAISGSQEFEKFEMQKKLKDALLAALENMKSNRTFKVSYIMTLLNTDTMAGATETRHMLSEMEKAGIKIIYLSAPKYKVTSEGKSYPEAEGKVVMATAQVQKNKHKFIFSIEKEKLKKEREGILESYLS